MMGEIYKATNNITGEIYIGATTKSMDQRKLDHIQKANNDLGSYFQKAIGTYGPEAFIWEQIDTANNNNELADKETQYILLYKSQENIYNLDNGGGFKKIVYCYDVDCNYIQSYNCLTEIKFDKRRISNACLTGTAYGNMFWSYKLFEKFIPRLDNRKKKVLQFDISGNLLNTFISVVDASKITGLSKTCIARCCRGEREKSGGRCGVCRSRDPVGG